ncbi:protein LEAD-SENSITIVE 1-like [Rutidosis leptorrhynchoides]|uniref:protein LEAD-SENSITIVE 1-like n=1 Tax=Rutidosis leptorrhynchoides TaxID=125765 RepID=UPI003A992D93
MDLISQKIETSALQEGDHIYTWRRVKTYSHHGIFVEKDIIIHFLSTTNVAGGISSVSSFSKNALCSMSHYGVEKVAGSGIRMCCIDCFIKKGKLYRFKYEASREFLLAKLRGGTCTTATPDTPGDVIARAIYLFENGYDKYHLLKNNCEDFALYCKTGLWSTDADNKGKSSQAVMVRKADDEHGHKSKKLVKRLKNVFPKYCLKRMNNDLGNRQDVVKIDLTELLLNISYIYPETD